MSAEGVGDAGFTKSSQEAGLHGRVGGSGGGARGVDLGRRFGSPNRVRGGAGPPIPAAPPRLLGQRQTALGHIRCRGTPLSVSTQRRDARPAERRCPSTRLPGPTWFPRAWAGHRRGPACRPAAGNRRACWSGGLGGRPDRGTGVGVSGVRVGPRERLPPADAREWGTTPGQPRGDCGQPRGDCGRSCGVVG